jgi:hypothetical protein
MYLDLTSLRPRPRVRASDVVAPTSSPLDASFSLSSRAVLVVVLVVVARARTNARTYARRSSAVISHTRRVGDSMTTNERTNGRTNARANDRVAVRAARARHSRRTNDRAFAFASRSVDTPYTPYTDKNSPYIRPFLSYYTSL